MPDVFGRLPEEAREKLRKKKTPRWSKPMLATLTDRRFSDPNWIFERKLDGVRCIAVRDGGQLRLVSRNGKRLEASRKQTLTEAERTLGSG